MIAKSVRSSDRLVIDMAPGGGWVGSFKPRLPASGKAPVRQPWCGERVVHITRVRKRET